jgi:hypothetical protein
MLPTKPKSYGCSEEDIIIYISPNGEASTGKCADFIVLYNFNGSKPAGYDEYIFYTFPSFRNRVYGMLVHRKHVPHIRNEANDDFNGIYVSIKFFNVIFRDYESTIFYNQNSVGDPCILIFFGNDSEHNTMLNKLVSLNDLNVYHNSAIGSIEFKEEDDDTIVIHTKLDSS